MTNDDYNVGKTRPGGTIPGWVYGIQENWDLKLWQSELRVGFPSGCQMRGCSRIFAIDMMPGRIDHEEMPGLSRLGGSCRVGMMKGQSRVYWLWFVFWVCQIASISSRCLSGMVFSKWITGLISKCNWVPGFFCDRYFGVPRLWVSSVGTNVKGSMNNLPLRWILFPLSRVAVPRNPKKFEIAKQLGATDCLNPKDYDKPIQQARHMPWKSQRNQEFHRIPTFWLGKEQCFQQVLTFEAFRIMSNSAFSTLSVEQ